MKSMIWCLVVDIHTFQKVLLQYECSLLTAHLRKSCRKEISREVPTFAKCVSKSIVYHRTVSDLSFLPLVKGILIFEIGVSLISNGFFSHSLTFFFSLLFNAPMPNEVFSTIFSSFLLEHLELISFLIKSY